MEEKVKRLEKENAQSREAKKEAASHRTQMEKELKRLSKESAEHEKALRRAVEKAVHDYPNSKEGKDFLKSYWASKLDEFKKFEYQQEVAKVAIPFLEYGFNACKDQFLAQGYTPAGRLSPIAESFYHSPYSHGGESSSRIRGCLDSLLGEVEAEVRDSPLQQLSLKWGELLSRRNQKDRGKAPL
ncbi:UNVERIFIED_CONTAM: hypothetical protein Sradi_7054800 [Sesamum radiatum]|uniref:Uncharacterized protein n=1 Tax=Sesamum radiatum TaxID=300843 RepID=A0AAW2J6L5_SESRA